MNKRLFWVFILLPVTACLADGTSLPAPSGDNQTVLVPANGDGSSQGPSNAVRLLVELARRFWNGLELHVETGVGFEGGQVQLKTISPAWLSYYASVGKNLLRYGLFKASNAKGYVPESVMAHPFLQDAYSDPRIAHMQEKFRAMLTEMNHPLAKHVKIFVGLFSRPNAYVVLQSGAMVCDRVTWETDAELAEIKMLHELGHIVNPQNARWFAEARALVPALFVAITGFVALQLMHHTAVRGVANLKVAALLGPALEKIQTTMLQKPFFDAHDELFADTFAAEHIEDPRVIQKKIDDLEFSENEYMPFYFRLPFVDPIIKRFFAGYPSRAERKANLEKIMQRRLAEEAISS